MTNITQADADATLVLMFISGIIGLVIGFLSGRLWEKDKQEDNKIPPFEDLP